MLVTCILISSTHSSEVGSVDACTMIMNSEAGRRTGLTRLILTVTLFVLIPNSESQHRPHYTHPPLSPLCMSQFALVTHACALIPFAPPREAAVAAATPALPPPPDTAPPRHHHHHHRHHKHDHPKALPLPHVPHQTEVQQECCRWLRNVDDSCVCDLLVLLPVFLSKPAHRYTVVVDDDCQVTFECPGRLIRP